MAYFVTYYTRTSDGVMSIPSNVFLKETHPIEWAANPSKASREVGLITFLLFWEEVPPHLLKEAEGWCGVED